MQEGNVKWFGRFGSVTRKSYKREPGAAGRPGEQGATAVAGNEAAAGATSTAAVDDAPAGLSSEEMSEQPAHASILSASANAATGAGEASGSSSGSRIQSDKAAWSLALQPSTSTRKRVQATKSAIENHYKYYMRNLQVGRAPSRYHVLPCSIGVAPACMRGRRCSVSVAVVVGQVLGPLGMFLVWLTCTRQCALPMGNAGPAGAAVAVGADAGGGASELGSEGGCDPEPGAQGDRVHAVAAAQADCGGL
eukprot:scaffold3352_cov326-Prasinococcus_capsulatus_cf.AAC.13